MEKFCTKCGKKFVATGREVICPACKESAKQEAKRAAVERAKRASWTGESVPVRISGRASTVIRKYGTANNLPFAAALDSLLKASEYFQSVGKAWEDIEPYKSRRLKKSKDGEQEKPQEVKPQEVKAAKTSSSKTAAKASSSKTTASKAAGKASEKPVKAAGKAASKASTSKEVKAK